MEHVGGPLFMNIMFDRPAQRRSVVRVEKMPIFYRSVKVEVRPVISAMPEDPAAPRRSSWEGKEIGIVLGMRVPSPCVTDRKSVV